ncbi:MAG: Flp pilus assembly protein CpaB [Proteobacteria bacterium]|nr:MAG: Flp pilus assembly protein CpaB [Pseudomonadota bacterium]
MEITQRKRPPLKGFIMLLVSLIVGAVAVFASKNYIQKQIQFYQSQIEKTEEMVNVVVPKKKLARGSIITSQSLAVRSIPTQYFDSNSVQPENYTVAIGQKLNFDLDEGRPLLWAHLDGGLAPTFSGKIEDGLRALTIRVDEINSISGFLQPMDNVDLLLTYQDEKEGKVTYPIMQSLHVLATGVKTVVDKTGRSAVNRYSTITVQVTPENAMKITLAQDVGKITATLRHPEDLSPMTKDVLTVADILNKPKKKIVRKKRAQKTRPRIDFIIGGV